MPYDSDSEEDITIQPHLHPKTSQVDGVSNLFGNTYLLTLTLIQLWSWFVNSCSYYGLNLAASDLGHGDLYLGLVLAGLVELPAYLLVIITLNYFGRKDNLAGYMISGGIAMLAIPFLASSFPFVIPFLGLLGKLCISNGFALIYIHR